MSREMLKFPRANGVPEDKFYARFVHPLVQKNLITVVDSLSEYKVDRFIVFGSAITEHCREDSDIDIGIIADISEKDMLQLCNCIRRSLSCELDLIDLRQLDTSDNIYMEIMKGVDMSELFTKS